MTSSYSEIPYNTHAINAYDSLHQGSDESTIVYLHRVQDILECIHHTSNMSSITAISTNHAKILTGLKDSQLQNKLAELKAKNGLPWPRFCKMLETLKGHMGIHFQHLMLNMFHLQILVPLTGPTSHLGKAYNNSQLDQKNPNVGIARENTSKRLPHSP